MNKIKGLVALLTLAIGLSSVKCDFLDPEAKSRRIAQNYTKCDTIVVEPHQTWSDIAKSICPKGVTYLDCVGREMKKLNPQIKNIHMIYPGQKIAVPHYDSAK